MKVTEKSKDGLARTFNVVVTIKELATIHESKLVEIAPTLNLKGFRKGKVPVAHVKRMYGKSIMADMLNELVQSGIDKVVADHKVRPASNPEISNIDNVNAVIDGAADLVFDVMMDILPDFTPVDVKTLEISRPITEATKEEVQTALEEIAKQSKSYETKKGKAKDGDAVIIDFLGKIDGVEFAGGKAEDAQCVLGSNSFIPGFESSLVGVKAGDETVINVTFPENYGVADLAGKAATFDIKVKDVQEAKETKVDDELAKQIGLSDLAALTEAVKTDIERQFAGLSRQKAKRALLDALDGAHSFELPVKMVDAEFDQIWAQVEADKKAGNEDPDDAGKSDADLKAEYRTIAERRVRLGLVLAEIGRVGEVQISDQEVGMALQREASQYPGQEQQVFDFFQKNPQMMAQLRAPLYEEKVVDFILANAKVTDVKVTKEELQADDDEASPAAKPAKKATKAKAEKADDAEAAPKAKKASSSEAVGQTKKAAAKAKKDA